MNGAFLDTFHFRQVPHFLRGPEDDLLKDGVSLFSRDLSAFRPRAKAVQGGHNDEAARFCDPEQFVHGFPGVFDKFDGCHRHRFIKYMF